MNLEELLPEKVKDYDIMFHDAIGMLMKKKNIYKELFEWLQQKENKVSADDVISKTFEMIFGVAEKKKNSFDNKQLKLLQEIEDTFNFSKDASIYLVSLLPINQIKNFLAWKEEIVIPQQKNGRVFDVRQLVSMILCGFFE